MTTYGIQGQVARNTTAYPPVPSYAPKVSTSTPLSPYAARTAAQTSAYTGVGAGTVPAQGSQPLTQPTKTVAPTPAGQPASQSTQAPAALGDYSTDPILQQVQANATRQQADADASALAARKQLAIQYGDADLASQIGDTSTAQAAASNPYSVYGLLNAQQPKDELALDEGLNKNNLFYSGARINQQHDLADTYGQHRAEAAGQEQQALGGIDQQRLSVYQAAQQAVTQALGDAYTRNLHPLAANPPQASSGAAPYAPTAPSDFGAGEQPNGGATPDGGLVPYTPTTAVDYQGPVVYGVPAASPGAATGKKPGKTVGGYIPGGAIRT